MYNLTLLPALCHAKRCDRFDLQLFAEGGGAAAAAAGTGETSGEGDAAATPPAYGQDAAATDTGKTAPPAQEALSSEPDKAAEFEKLIRGEYKEQFTQRLQHILEKRLKAAKSETGKAEADAKAEQERKNSAAEAICKHWAEESRALRATYPDFAFGKEAKNPAFAALLKAGVPVKNAYEACHLGELLGGAMQYTADKVSAAMAKQYAARAARPAENGTTARAGAVMKTDVSRLTRTEREAIERRVAHGERIRF